MGYKLIAEPLAQRGIPTIPLRPRTKIAFLTEWETKATTDFAQIEKWDAEYPEANAGCVALGNLNGVWFFEVDKPEVVQRIETETGNKLPRTFRVRSRPGRGHFYFKQTEASLKMGNIAQGFIKHGDWSARVDRQYVVAPGSLHPNTGLPYEIVSMAEIIEAPQWLIDWLLSQKVEKKSSSSVEDDTSPIPDGARDSTLASIAGGFRYKGMNQEEIEMVLLRINRDRCKPPLPESQVQKIAWSIARYKSGPDSTVLVDGKVAGSNPTPEPTVEVSEPVEAAQIATIPYPNFPLWVIDGTSIGEGLVKPICEKNCRYPEYMFMPAMAMMLNYIGTRVTIKHNPMMKPNLFMVLVGKRGQIIKSSSVQDAIEYFRYCGVADHFSPGMTNAADKTVVFEVGSPEALGIQMARINCKNAVLFYDELTTLTNKASIESSTLTSRLLTLYESGNFQNLIKSHKESYSLAPNTYCASLIACCTDKNFLTAWSKMSGKSSGMDDRFFFLYQPETFHKPMTPMIHVPTMFGAVETRKLIDKAITKKEYAVTDMSPLQNRMQELGNRAEIRAEKFALYFAIDRGLEEIDEDCIERALALVDYEKAVKRFIAPFEGETREGTIQLRIINILQRRPGGMAFRDLERELHSVRMGTGLWQQCFKGLLQNGWVAEVGTGKKGDPKRIILLRASDEDED